MQCLPAGCELADMFTKPFSSEEKWRNVMTCIGMFTKPFPASTCISQADTSASCLAMANLAPISALICKQPREPCEGAPTLASALVKCVPPWPPAKLASTGGDGKPSQKGNNHPKSVSCVQRLAPDVCRISAASSI